MHVLQFGSPDGSSVSALGLLRTQSHGRDTHLRPPAEDLVERTQSREAT